MRIDRYEPALIDSGLAQGLAELRNAAAAVDAPHVAPVSAEWVRLRTLHADEDRPVPHLFVAVDDHGAVIGAAEVRVETWDNHHLASIDLETHPAVRGHGVGEQLYAEALRCARSLGKTLLIAGTWAGSHREEFWRRNGFSVAARDAQRRLVVAELAWARLDELHARSVAASQGYEIVTMPTPTPAEKVDALLELNRAMNDSPIDDLEIEDDVWVEERLRNDERAQLARGIRLHRLVARRLDDGELAGHTVVEVEDERPQLGFQGDTAVTRAHRGHRLGMRLKIEMLRLLADIEPQMVQIDTWNAESNAHMIAVNDALGCVVVGRTVELQLRLPVAGQAQSWPSSRSSASSTVPS
jgi:GNAT superfamily N-acetyltransferase